MYTASRTTAMARSGIREIADLAWARPDVIRLEMGEPAFATPPHIVEAAAAAARAGHTHYSPSAGVPELREALAAKVRRVNGVPARASNMIVSHGSGQGIFATLACLVGEGDEVLVPDPGWPNYRMMTSILGADAVGYHLPHDRGYEPDFAQLEATITERTRVIIVNSPSNPLGSVLSVDSMAAILEIARERDLWIISDECYDQIVFDHDHVSMATLESNPEHVVTAWSLSKSFAMTGWRVGYLHAPDSLVSLLAKVQEPLIACVNGPAQYAALAAVTGPQDFVDECVVEYGARARLAHELLTAGGLDAILPRGAFYSWVVLPEDVHREDVAHELVMNHGVAVAPGPTFGQLGRHAIRISLAASRDDLVEGIGRILGSGLVGSARRTGVATATPGAR